MTGFHVAQAGAWPGAYYVADGDLETPRPPASTFQLLGCRYVYTGYIK